MNIAVIEAYIAHTINILHKNMYVFITCTINSIMYSITYNMYTLAVIHAI